jgi:hypothetical protein
MNAAAMPGFTGEYAMYKTKTHYRLTENFDSQSNSLYLQPAVLNLCDVLHDMAWNAYDNRNYELVEVIDAVMEGAGCFR